MLPVDHNQTRTGFGNGQVGLSDCPAARDIPSAPPPAFSRGVCGAVPPARVCPTAAVAGFEKVLVDRRQGAMRALPTACISDPSGASVERGLAGPRPTLPSVIRRQGDSRSCPGWSGFGRPGVRIGRGGSADQRGRRRAAPANSALRRKAGRPPVTSPPPQSEEPKPFASRLAGCARGCNKRHVCACTSSPCERSQPQQRPMRDKYVHTPASLTLSFHTLFILQGFFCIFLFLCFTAAILF